MKRHLRLSSYLCTLGRKKTPVCFPFTFTLSPKIIIPAIRNRVTDANEIVSRNCGNTRRAKRRVYFLRSGLLHRFSSTSEKPYSFSHPYSFVHTYTPLRFQLIYELRCSGDKIRYGEIANQRFGANSIKKQ